MRKIIFFILILTSLSSVSLAQDYLFFTDGSVRSGEITRVGHKYLHWYENTAFHSTPVYAVNGFRKDGLYYQMNGGNAYEVETGIMDIFEAKEFFSNIKPFSTKWNYMNVRSTNPINLNKGNNRIITGGLFIILSGVSLGIGMIVPRPTPDLMIGLSVTSIVSTITGGTFILSGARKNKIESQKFRFTTQKPN
jgi:hypothetical protein